MTLEAARLATGAEVAGAEFPEGADNAAKLTIFCAAGDRHRGRPAYREAVAALRRAGATGAIVLPGVDGARDGWRGRARLFSANGDTPMVIVSVGPTASLRRSLPALAALLPEPLVTLEPITQVKHDGKLLRSPLGGGRGSRSAGRRSGSTPGATRPSTAARSTASSHGACARAEPRASRRCWGDWGFSSDEQPYGDRLGRVSSHRPTYTVYIDRPDRIAAAWPLVDELTAVHGLVTSGFVPG